MCSSDLSAESRSRCLLEFPVFHRYFFSGFLDVITLAYPRHSSQTQICDVIFGTNWMTGRAGQHYFPGIALGDPEVVIGHLATSIANFYTRIVRPAFCRHLAGLYPEPRLARNPNYHRLYLRQVTVYNMLITLQDLETLLHYCERGEVGNSDSFINITGVHSVLDAWDKIGRAHV